MMAAKMSQDTMKIYENITEQPEFWGVSKRYCLNVDFPLSVSCESGCQPAVAQKTRLVKTQTATATM
jgi:hypothetical protein